MAKRIPQAFIDEVITRLDIVEIINQRIQLKKTGSNYSACCPFHDEKTPSFSVSPSKQFYHCFGCGESGNALGFIMAYERMEFLDALEMLAGRVGLELPKRDNDNKDHSQHKVLYELTGKAMVFYQKHLLRSQKAQDYLKQRGLSDNIIQQYGLGYAPPGWDSLLKKVSGDNKQQQLLLGTGLLISKSEDNYYDRFRDRVMFPIRDTRGRVIGFGGRCFGDEQPKYLNSPETAIFHKGNELYGLYEARQANRDLSRIIIVEGYMDVISLAQHGISYAAATLGTATSTRHIQLLLRFTSHIVFCFDGDRAGKQAAWRALTTCLPLMHDGLQINFMFLPQKEDPDTLIQNQGHDAFEELIDQAQSLADYFFDHLQASIDIKTLAGKAKLAQLAKQHFSTMPNGVYKQLLTDRLNQLIGISIDQLNEQMQSEKQTAVKKVNPRQAVRSAAQHALSLLLQQPQLARDLPSLPPLDQNLPGTQLLLQCIEFFRTQTQANAASLLTHWQDRPELQQIIRLANDTIELSEVAIEQEFADAMRRLAKQSEEQQVQALIKKATEQGLTPEEKQQLQQMIAKNKGILSD